MTHLLLDERPMMVLPSLAKAYGNANKAIAVQHIHWVVIIKEEHEDDRTFYDGYLWCKLSLKQWQRKLCWMSMSGIRKMLTQLEETGTVISCKPFSVTGDHTKWYRIDYENLSIFACPKVTNPELSKSDTPACPKVTNLDVPKSDKSSIDKKISKDPFKESEGKTDLPTENTQTILAGQTNQNGITPKNQSGVKDLGSAPPLSVAFTAKPPTPLEWVEQKVKELTGDRFEQFIESRRKCLLATSYWQQLLASNPQARITTNVVLNSYAKKITPVQFQRFSGSEEIEAEKAAIAEQIKTDVEMSGVLSISAANQPHRAPLRVELDRLIELHKKDPVQALREARGNQVLYNRFLKETRSLSYG